jgi:hypothetical protein
VNPNARTNRRANSKDSANDCASAVGLTSGHSSCEVVICGRSRIGWHGGAGVFPHLRPDQTRRREGGLAREPKLCTCRYGNLLTSALELSLTGRRISTPSRHSDCSETAIQRKESGHPSKSTPTGRPRFSDAAAQTDSHHLPAKAGETRCSRSGACGCWAAFGPYSRIGEPIFASTRGSVVARLGVGIKFCA